MAKIKFDIEVKKLAVVPTNKGMVRIGVVEYQEDKDGVRSVLIDVDKTVPEQMLEDLKQHPELIQLAEEASMPKNFVVIPGDTIIT